MPTLDVPGASLSYETHGSGPLIVFIPGGQGTGDVYHPIATALAAKYTSVTYDRRGFSASILTSEQDYIIRMQTDVDDAHALIKHLSPDGTAVVFGSSSGAIVALFLLLSYPESIRTVIPHEPPAIDLLPDREAWTKWQNDLYDTFKTEGQIPAFLKFVESMSGGMELQMFKQRWAMLTDEQENDLSTQRMRDQAYWFEHEVRQYPLVKIDIEAIAKHKDKLLLAVGEDSKEMFVYRPIKILSEKLDLPLLEVPGAHVGYAYAAEAFAQVLAEALAKKGQ